MTSAFMQVRPGEVTVHPPQQFYIGDDWSISTTCNDADGNAIDLNDAALVYRLNDAVTMENVAELEIGSGITLIENASGDLIDGLAQIVIDKSVTALFAPGNYLDELTVTANSHTSTQWRGRIDALAKLPVSGE